MGYLNMTGSTVVHRGMKSIIFPRSGMKRWLKSFDNISVKIKIEKRANSMWASNALPNLIVLSYFNHSDDIGQNSWTPPSVM